MALATVYSRARQGMDAPLVSVEVHLANGLPGFSLVGLPEAAVRESKDRVRAAIINSGFSFPARRITVNLAPADLPKDGGRFDLPIAIGILVAAGELNTTRLTESELIGELSLTGALRPVMGALPAVMASRRAGRTLILPSENRAEAGLVSEASVCAAPDLLAVCADLAGQTALPLLHHSPPAVVNIEAADLSEVRGQQQAKRALEIAAAGMHHLLMVGPPGSGKSMLSQRITGILPPLSDEEALEVATVRSLSASGMDVSTWKQRPFRAPHHTSSAVALAGGGGQPRPGEISLAHQGVLFLDELPEFSRATLEILREPMESGEICISRAARQATYPATFQLVAAMNPCPCGWWGDASGRCHCSQEQVMKYRSKISGPLMDRIDMQLAVQPVPVEQLSFKQPLSQGEESESVRRRVSAARARQLSRQGKPNAKLSPAELGSLIEMPGAVLKLAEEAVDRLQLSARAYHRVLRVAQTIADLSDSPVLEVAHLGEALQYRQLDRI